MSPKFKKKIVYSQIELCLLNGIETKLKPIMPSCLYFLAHYLYFIFKDENIGFDGYIGT